MNRERAIWNAMLRRCTNETASDYPRYGGRMTIHPDTARLIRAYAPSVAHHVTEQDPMDTVEAQTDKLVFNVASAIEELATARKNPEAMKVIKANRVRVLLALDVLALIADEVEGKV